MSTLKGLKVKVGEEGILTALLSQWAIFFICPTQLNVSKAPRHPALPLAILGASGEMVTVRPMGWKWVM